MNFTHIINKCLEHFFNLTNLTNFNNFMKKYTKIGKGVVKHLQYLFQLLLIFKFCLILVAMQALDSL